jgi:hypothetical protein
MGNVSHRSADLVPDCATKTATSGKSSLMWNQGALYATKT